MEVKDLDKVFKTTQTQYKKFLSGGLRSACLQVTTLVFNEKLVHDLVLVSEAWSPPKSEALLGSWISSGLTHKH
jgi:hypothetical protein